MILKNKFGKALISILIILPILVIFLYQVFKGPYSPEVIGLTIFLHKNFFKSKQVLQEYVLLVKLDKSLGENTLKTLPEEIDIYLVNLLRSDPSAKRNIIDSYLDITSDLPECCHRLSVYEDKTLIGDVIEYAKPLDSRRKLVAIKLIEDLRTNFTKEDPMYVLPALIEHPDEGDKALADQHIQNIFNLYERWWALSIPLDEKLKVDPLRGSRYGWWRPY